MPHIVFKEKTQKLKVPSNLDGTEFEFIAKSYNFTNKPRKTEYKVSTKKDGKKFLLSLKQKKENFLLKPDKITRISPAQLLKDSINSYAKLANAEILFSNTQNFNKKIEPSQEFLKDINYFVNSFKTSKEIQIEIGFGSGRHLLHQAKNNPDIQFIGLEIHTPSIEQLLKQIKIQNLHNILVVNYDARLFMEFINSNSVGKVFVHFPVPWDKKPHRRIYSNAFIKETLRVLKVNGSLELRTDSRKYFDYCVELLTNLQKARITIDINKDLEISSKYEDRWKKQGKNIYDVLLFNKKEDEQKNLTFDFTFKKTFDFQNIIQNIPSKTLVKEDYFIHFEDIFKIEDRKNSGLLQVTFGSFDRPVSKYILVDEGKASYYQDLPLPTSLNIKAHETIKKILEK